MRIGKMVIISCYDDQPLAIYDDQYCFLHNYKELFKNYNIIEEEKINTVKFYILTKR